MDYFKDFFIINFVVLFAAIIMFYQAVNGYKVHKKLSMQIIWIFSVLLLLSVLEILRDVFRYEVVNVEATTAMTFFIHVLRPFAIFIFILMSGQNTKTVIFKIILVPLIFNFVVHLFTFFPATKESIYYYLIDSNGTMSLVSGNGFLYFTSHFVSVFYLLYLILRSLSMLKLKHYTHAINIIICAVVIAIAVTVDTFFNDKGNIHLSNSAIAVSAVIYYLYLYTENDKYDALTGVFNRKTYYNDLSKFDKDITAVIQLDMNGLKYLNDNFGHIEGDKALKTAADIFSWSATRYMYVYRLGGDEFIILVTHDGVDKIEDVISRIRRDLRNSHYSCAIGYSYREQKETTILELIKQSEEKMYQDKADFYKDSKIDRRKSKAPGQE